jgi:hypothetical protein
VNFRAIKVLAIFGMLFIFYTDIGHAGNSVINQSRMAPAVAEAHKNFELRIAPAAILASWYTIDGNYIFNDQFMFGPSITSYSNRNRGGMFLPTYFGTALGLSSVFCFRNIAKSSGYLSAHAYTEKYESRPHAYLGYVEAQGTRANIDLGYRWITRTKFNIMLGGGYEFIDQDREDFPESGITPSSPHVGKYHESNSYPHIEFKIGIDL